MNRRASRRNSSLSAVRGAAGGGGSNAAAAAAVTAALHNGCLDPDLEVERAVGPPPAAHRVAMLGASGVGKSALTSQFLSSDHMNTYDAVGGLPSTFRRSFRISKLNLQLSCKRG